jgi:hypothetical protein
VTVYDAERGRRIITSGKYAPERGEHLGTLQVWGLDVYEDSPQHWIDTLHTEQREP